MSVSNRNVTGTRASVVLAVAILTTLAALWYYSRVVYDGNSEGIAYSSGGLLGTLAIALLIGFFVNGRRFSRTLFAVCLLVSLAVFGASKFEVFREALEAREYKSLVANAASPKDIITLSTEHPSNRFLAFVAAIMAARVESDKSIAELLAPLETYNPGCVTRVAKKDRSALGPCYEYFKHMGSSIDTVRVRYAEFELVQRERATKLILDLSEQYKFKDASIARGAQQGLNTGLERTKLFSEQYLASIEAVNNSYIDLVSFMTDHFSEYAYDTPTKRVMWNTNELLGRYNPLVDRATKAEAHLSEVVQQEQAYEKDRFNRLTR